MKGCHPNVTVWPPQTLIGQEQGRIVIPPTQEKVRESEGIVPCSLEPFFLLCRWKVQQQSVERISIFLQPDIQLLGLQAVTGLVVSPEKCMRLEMWPITSSHRTDDGSARAFSRIFSAFWDNRVGFFSPVVCTSLPTVFWLHLYFLWAYHHISLFYGKWKLWW